MEIAQESLRMSREKEGDKVFRMLAIGMMMITGIATAFHAFHSVYRDVRGRRESRDRDLADRREYPSRGEHEYNSAASRNADSQREESIPGRSWASREERRGRWPEDEEHRDKVHRHPGRSMER